MTKRLPKLNISQITAETAGKKTPQGQWTPETKYEVVWSLVTTGNLRETSRRTKVPVETIRLWRDSDWWPAMIAEVKAAQRDELNSKLGVIVESALDKVKDRLDNGDFILNNKTGEIVRKPVNLKDAGKVLNDVMGNQIKLDKANEIKPTSQQSIGDMLKTLATEFAKFNRKQDNKNVVDIEFKEVTNALHDQRKEGLQEGSS